MPRKKVAKKRARSGGYIAVRVTDQEMEKVHKAVLRFSKRVELKVPVSTWARKVVMEAAEHELGGKRRKKS